MQQAKRQTHLKFAFVGGGSGGPVTPLLAVLDELRRRLPHAEFFYLGGRSVFEQRLTEHYQLRRFTVPGGKFRRYFSLKTLLDFFLVCAGFLKALWLLLRLRPDAVFAAGSYRSVPVGYAGWVLRIPVIIHQQDFDPSLSNKLLYPIAARVTVSLEKSQRDFYASSGLFRKKSESKITLTGNPVRRSVLDAKPADAIQAFGLDPSLPVLLVLGGGTGSAALNRLVAEAAPDLARTFEVIHVTGPGKNPDMAPLPHYQRFEMLADRLPAALAAAAIVLSRAGFATITELAALRKVSVLVPMPNSHQEQNARLLRVLNAAIVADESALTPENLVRNLRKLLFDIDAQKTLKQNIGRLMPVDAAARIAVVLIKTAQNHV